MPEERKGLLYEIADDVSISPEQVLRVLESFLQQLHKGMYEYDGGNGDFVTEQLRYELSDTAWIHLYQFLLLHRLRHGCEYPKDEIEASYTQLDYMGGAEQWQQHFIGMRNWRMSSKFGFDRPLY